MKRRTFLQSLSAFSILPAVPVKAVASYAKVQAVPSSGAVYWANYLSKYHQNCTPASLRAMMGISESTAVSLHNMLVSQNVLTPLGAIKHDLVSAQIGKIEASARGRPVTLGEVSEKLNRKAETRSAKEEVQKKTDKSPELDEVSDQSEDVGDQEDISEDVTEATATPDQEEETPVQEEEQEHEPPSIHT